MKIDLAVWTAVNGYDWQPGSVYSPKELAGYKDEIGPLVPDSLPLGGLFLKGGRAVFYRVQIAERMDSRGRGAIYCVLGTVPEDRAKDIDFSVVFNSAEMARPQKPFPTAIEYNAEVREFRSPLGHTAFDEKRFTGVETFSELGGWCEEAKGGKLNVKITGSIDAPLFAVNYTPHVEPIVVPSEPPLSPPRQQNGGSRDVPPCQPYQQPPVRQIPDPYMADLNNEPFNYAEKSVKPSHNSFLNGFVAGTIFGIAITAIVAWLFWPSKKGTTEYPQKEASISIPPNHKINAGSKSMPENDSRQSVNSQQTTEEQTEKHKDSNRVCPKCAGRGAVRSLWERNSKTCSYCSGMGYVHE